MISIHFFRFCPIWIILILSQFIIIPSVLAEVWKVQNDWNREWENRYAQWLAAEVKPTLLTGSGLKADCADLVYALRAIFSREHGLPFMASTAEGRRFGHFSTQWDRYPTQSEWRQDIRFCKFLADLFRDVVSTRSLHHDTYPIAVNPQSLQPGVMVYEDYLAAHVVVIGQINRDTPLPITYYESFVPGHTIFFTAQKIEVHVNDAPGSGRYSGVVRWKWPVRGNPQWDYLSESAMPDYAAVPFPTASGWQSNVGGYLNRIAFEELYQKPFTITAASESICREISDRMAQRALRIRQTQELIQRYNLDRLPSIFEQKYDTSALDQQLFQLVSQFRTWANGYAVSQAELYKNLQDTALYVSQYHAPVALTLLLDAFDPGRISANPRDPIQKRWGIVLVESRPTPPMKTKPPKKSRFNTKLKFR